MSSFSIPLTGLEASSKALNTIANNLANMNTTAFKSQDVTFSDLFYQQIGTTGSGNPLQVGAGTKVASTQTDFTQGGIEETGDAQNAYIDGNGFFLVQSSDGATALTRDGNFTTNGGYLMTQDGQNVMGYPAASGVVNTNSPLTPIQLPVGQVENAQATTTMSMTANLNAADTVGTTVSGQVQIYDSLGEAHEATVYFTKTGTNTWGYSMSLDPSTVTATTSTLPSKTLTPTAPAAGSTAWTFDPGATVDPSTNMTISDGTNTATVAPFTAGESLNAYYTALRQAVTTNGVNASVTLVGNTLTVAPTNAATLAISKNVVESSVTTYDYKFANGDTVDPSTNLTITGTSSTGTSVSTTPPPVIPGESLNSYMTALNTALAGIPGAVATNNGTSISIAGAGISTAGNVLESAAGTASSNASGSLQFDANGNLISPTTNVAGIQLGGLADGAAGLGITWDLFGSNGTSMITQSSSDASAASTAVTATSQNGYASGTYQGFAIDSSGVVSASFSNGETQVVGQIALANVANEQGLTINPGNSYSTTAASGSATTGVAGTSGLGTLEDDALENSNVDISTQFSNLIVAQQAYDANSKAITTFDTISQDTLNMIH
jgi:flagellar hook protein FlgE